MEKLLEGAEGDHRLPRDLTLFGPGICTVSHGRAFQAVLFALGTVPACSLLTLLPLQEQREPQHYALRRRRPVKSSVCPQSLSLREASAESFPGATLTGPL